ncbi:MAG: hypothetical protein M5U26_06940 [Planctomycetota bacterium]|nr:hypothetical protein [Planctomycetota bacterium]
MPNPAWTPILTCAFDGPARLEEWKLEGAADVSITPERELLIANVKRRIGPQEVFRSTLWRKEPLWGDLKFEFEVKGEPKNGNIFFFNAQPLQGCKSIFDWERPLANYVEYTGDPRLQLYTLGMLRYGQDVINVRYLGGTNAGLVDLAKADPTQGDPDHQGLASKEFEEKSIFHSAPSPFRDPERYYRIELAVVANRLTVDVDGRRTLDYVDEPRAASPLRGGFFGFRNFALTKTWCRSLRVWRLE